MVSKITLNVSLAVPGPASAEGVMRLRDDVERYLSHLLNVRTLNGMPVQIANISVADAAERSSLQRAV